MSEADMDVVELKELALKLAVVADRLDDRSEQAVRRVEHVADRLDQAAQGLSDSGRQLAQDALRVVEAQAGSTIQQGLGRALGHCQAQLQAAAKVAESAAMALEAQRRGLQNERRNWVWIGSSALLIGSLLATGGSWYLVRKNMRELERAEFGSDILRATQSGALTRCGEALCIKAGKHARRYGAKGEYVLLEN